MVASSLSVTAVLSHFAVNNTFAIRFHKMRHGWKIKTASCQSHTHLQLLWGDETIQFQYRKGLLGTHLSKKISVVAFTQTQRVYSIFSFVFIYFLRSVIFFTFHSCIFWCKKKCCLNIFLNYRENPVLKEQSWHVQKRYPIHPDWSIGPQCEWYCLS